MNKIMKPAGKNDKDKKSSKKQSDELFNQA